MCGNAGKCQEYVSWRDHPAADGRRPGAQHDRGNPGRRHWAGGGKPATMETGLVVQVPDFIKNGEKLIIGTENGDYKSRADSQPR